MVRALRKEYLQCSIRLLPGFVGAWNLFAQSRALVITRDGQRYSLGEKLIEAGNTRFDRVLSSTGLEVRTRSGNG